jgi:hypothetical protein
MHDTYEDGVVAGFQSLGLEKEAAGFAAKVLPTLKAVGHDARLSLIGQPIRFIKELFSGRAFSPGGVLRENLIPQSALGKGLVFGIPALQGAAILRDNSPDKASQLGGLATGTALSTAAFGPLGGLGAAMFYGPGEAIGKKLVSAGRGILGHSPNPSAIPPRSPALQSNPYVPEEYRAVSPPGPYAPG